MATEIHEIVCILCPVGCRIIVEIEDGEVVRIDDAGCERGKDYSLQEIRSPIRDFFTTIRVADGKMPLVSVRSTEPIPKNMLMPCAAELAKRVIPAPVRIGDIIIKNIMKLGADIIATKDVDKA
jgi:CxxC motif-containing protein